MFIKMKNKKGFLLAEETLKIVIAVISIGFLIYFLTALYMSNKDSKDLELAKASLQHLVDEINEGRESVEIYNPEASFPTYWQLYIWPYGGENTRPKSCSNMGWTKCTCICGIDSFKGRTHQDRADICDEKGVCLEFNKELKINHSSIRGDGVLEITDPPIQLQINYELGEITKK